MFIDLTPEQLALRDELRAYFAALIPSAESEAMLTDRHGDVFKELVRRMGRDGWLGVGWPVEYGVPRVRPGGAADLRQRSRPG